MRPIATFWGREGKAGCAGSGEAFDDHGHALAAADAHALEPIAGAGVLETVEERGHDPRASHAERVTEGDRAAVRVELLPRDAELSGRRHHLRGERLIDLDQVDVVDRQPRASERLPAGL